MPIGEMTDYRGCGFETDHKDGSKFWTTYIYNRVAPYEYELLTILQFLGEPTLERIQKNIDQEVYGEW